MTSYSIVEPCAGAGDISTVFRGKDYAVTCSDNDPARGHPVADARTLQYDPKAVVVTNPPFNIAHEIVQNAVEQGNLCCFLLRLSFLEPTFDRGDWLADNPPEMMIVLPRISFTGDGKTDSVTCAWMIWNYDTAGAAPIQVVSKGSKEDGKRKQSDVIRAVHKMSDRGSGQARPRRRKGP